jgi:hypothetical protein
MPPKDETFLRRVVGTIIGSQKGMPDYDERSSQERRSQNRGSRRLPIRFFDPNRSDSHQGILINGSGGGAFIETNHALPLLTKIRIEGPGMVFHAEVCRVHWLGPEERGSRSGGMAVRLLAGEAQFEDADYEDEDGTVLNIANAQHATV